MSSDRLDLHDLGGLQRAFCGFVRRGETAIAGALRPDLAPNRLAIYRNHVIGSLAHVLENAHPTLRRILGGDFLPLAYRFAEEAPPDQPALWRYGADFAAWVEAEDGVPAWAGDVARLDWAMQEALFAADAPAIDPARLQAIPAGDQAHVRLMPHPSVRLVQARWSVHAVWRGAGEPAPEPEAILIGRARDEVVCARLTAQDGGTAARVLAGATLSEAAETGGDLQTVLARLIGAGLIAGFALAPHTQPPSTPD